VAETAWTVAELLQAGWTETDLAWERHAVATLEALARGESAAAQRHAGAAVSLAREYFTGDDPRLAAALANFAVTLESGGKHGAELLAEAGRIWASCTPWLEAMTAPRSAKSSMFHLRMEARHRDTYRERWAVKWRELANEGRGSVASLALGSKAIGDNPAGIEERLQRWRRECPAMLNDTRKLLAAVILTAAPANSAGHLAD
jgi:hypothetical protein